MYGLQPFRRQQGVNRVVLAVWDLEAGIEFYSALLGSAFSETTTDRGRAFGVRVAMNFDAGVELVAPLPEADTSPIRDHLEAHGEGVSGVVFAVPDLDAADAAAQANGWSRYYEIDFDDTELAAEHDGRFSRFREFFYQGQAPLPVTVLLGEFELRPESAPPDGP